MRPPGKIIGIDFSGAKDCGRKIWIAEGRLEGGALGLQRVDRADRKLAVKAHPEALFPELRRLIAEAGSAAVGVDAPFSVCGGLMRAANANVWRDYLGVVAKCGTADLWRASCSVVPERCSKRVTDQEAQTPFAPHNLRLFKQTYFFLHSVLHPLVADQKVYVVPFDNPASFDRPWLLETCPASALRHLGLREPYKGRAAPLYRARRRILDALVECGWIRVPPPELRAALIGDTGGDALDSAIAAAATARAVKKPRKLFSRNAIEAVEGRVYFT